MPSASRMAIFRVAMLPLPGSALRETGRCHHFRLHSLLHRLRHGIGQLNPEIRSKSTRQFLGNIQERGDCANANRRHRKFAQLEAKRAADVCFFDVGLTLEKEFACA